MLSHYFKIAFRSLLKFKGFALINLAGLGLGLTTGILIMVFVLDELSFDKFHTNADRLYRIDTAFGTNGNAEGFNETNGWPVGHILRTEFPEVESVLYTRNASMLLLDADGKKIKEKIHFASPEFFTMFSFPLKKGNPESALSNPFSIVISEVMEHKYFGDEDALGKTLRFNDTLFFQVTAVMANIPANSHIQTSMVASFASYQKMEPSFSYSEGWGNINMRNYILLKDGVDVQAFQQKIKNIYMDRAGDMLKSWGTEAYVILEPFKDIYLKTTSGNGMGPLGSINRVYLLSGVALFVILLACINFINLTTARSTYRAKEVGLRKVVGSARPALIRQFLGESFVMTALSLVVAAVITVVFLPVFNELLGKSYTLQVFFKPSILSGILILLAFISLLAGYYPALVLSGLKPVEILKGRMQTGARGVQLRRMLVVFQFVVSASLITGTMVIIEQLTYMQKENLGFAKDEIFVINVARVNAKTEDAFTGFLNEIRSQAIVKNVTLCNALPGTPGWSGQVAYPDGKSGEHAVDLEYMAIDENYVNTLDISLVAGRNFDPQRIPDMQDGLLINERAVDKFGFETPENAIGKKITSPSGYPEGIVIGVVKDYHAQGLQQRIGPIAMDVNQRSSYLYAIRYTAANTREMISAMEQLWKKYFPAYDYNYFFLDQSFEKQYQSEQRLANVFAIFSIVTIAIAIIGLFGLLSFIVITKTKEIGIRKVLGANMFSIARLISFEFIALVVLANAIALPVTWYFADEWLTGFAYRMTISPMIFVITCGAALVLTLTTVSFQAFRAASSDPVKSLRSE